MPARFTQTSLSLRHALLALTLAGCAALVFALAVTPAADGKLSKPTRLSAGWNGVYVKLAWKRVSGARAYAVKRCTIRRNRCAHSLKRVARVGKGKRGKLVAFRDRGAPVGRTLGYRVWALGKKGKHGKRKLGRRSRLIQVKTSRALVPGGPGSGRGRGAPAPAPSPRATAPPPVRCDSEASGAGLAGAVASAPAGSTICVPGGSYPAVNFTAARSAYVTVAAKPGQTVTFADIDFGGNAAYIRLQGLHVNGQIELVEEGPHHIDVTWSWIVGGVSVKWGGHDVLVEHNDIRSPSGNGVELISTQPSPGSPGSPTNLAPVERITIRGNKLHDIGTDALFMGNYRDILIEDNEISGLNETGQHTDSLQSVYGGSRLTFRGNYVHDNRGEGFFVKDGQAKDLVVEDNLFVRTRDLWQISFYNSIPESTPYGAKIVRNTIWESNLPINVLGTENRSVFIHNNVFNDMYVETPSARAQIDQTQNVIEGSGRQPGDVAADAVVRLRQQGRQRLAPGVPQAGVPRRCQLGRRRQALRTRLISRARRA